MKMGKWNPGAKSISILNRAYEHVCSVPYKVSLRWLFYRLLQDGIYQNKVAYDNKFMPLVSKARKNFFGPWRPDTLADETRQSIVRHGEFKDFQDWLDVVKDLDCSLDEWYYQRYYVEVCFEAKAMADQFKTLIPDYITLNPFGGDAPIPYKWGIAKRLERNAALYRTPIIIIYFGDCDKKGLQIPKSAFRDIQAWCNKPIEFVIGGLTQEQAIKYNLPENPEKPGYQWEALSDDAAKEIINGSLEHFLDHRAFNEARKKELEATEFYRRKINEIDWGKEFGE